MAIPAQSPRSGSVRGVALPAPRQRLPNPSPSDTAARRRRDRRRGCLRRSRGPWPVPGRSRSARAWIPPARRSAAGPGGPPLLPRLFRSRGRGDRRDPARNREVEDPSGYQRTPRGTRGRRKALDPGRESGMTDRTNPPIDLDGTLTAWLERTAPDREPEQLLGRILETTAVTRRRPTRGGPGGHGAWLGSPR